MNAHDEDRIKQLLKQTLPPIKTDAEPGRDLWPALLRRLDEDTATPQRASSDSMPWFDGVLVAGLIVFAAAFPATIPVLLYYL